MNHHSEFQNDPLSCFGGEGKTKNDERAD